MKQSTEYFIHYGSNKFDLSKFNQIHSNINFDMPYIPKTLYACHIETNDWKKFCKNNNSIIYSDDYFNTYFIFHLKENSKILCIDKDTNIYDLDQYTGSKYIDPCWHNIVPMHFYLDFERISHDYDAIDINLKELDTSSENYFRLHGLYTSSLLVFNPDIIVQNKM